MDPASYDNPKSPKNGFPGYTLSEDNLLEINRDENGDAINPNLILTTDCLCAKCEEIMVDVETRYNQGPTLDDFGNRNIAAFYEKLTRGDSGSSLKRETRVLASVPFHSSMSDLRKSVEIGCCLCAKLLSAFTIEVENPARGTFHNPPGSIKVKAYCEEGVWNPSDELHLEQGFEDEPGISRHIELRHYGGKRVDRSENLSVALSASNMSDVSFDLATSWLRTCQREHLGCRLNLLKTYQSPKRLLDVGEITAATVRVVYPKEKHQYLTVSHCWGQLSHNLVLGEDTHEAMVSGYDDRTLPRLVRDCVMVTRKLGFRYLWIDTMCILQDNTKDKAEEIQKMGDIYAGSTCNIAAVSASDSRSSLFTRYLPLISYRCYFRPSGTGDTFDIRGYSNRGHCPLNDRAWVIQEKILSPRALNYTHAGISWHCNGAGDEVLPLNSQSAWNRLLKLFHLSQAQYGSSDNTGGRKRSTSWPTQLHRTNIALTDYEKFTGQDAWNTIVGSYCAAKFSYEDDRKVGLLGVISTLKERTGLSVSHGVCHDFFPYCLLWRMWASQLRIENPSYYGPSWSNLYQHGKTSQLGPESHESTQYCATNYFFNDRHSIISLTGRYFRYLFKPEEATDPSNWTSKINIPDGEGNTQKLSLHMDSKVINSTQVELVLLVQGQLNYGGLVLQEVPGNSGLWTRLGAFEDSWENRFGFKNYQEIPAFFSEEKSYRIV